MTNPTNNQSVDLEELACRVEGLSGPDREVDELVADALFERSRFAQLADAPIGTGCMMWWQDGHEQSALRYTASLDAAMTLVKEDAFWRVGHDGEGPDPSLLKAIISVAKEGEVAITFKTALADTAPLALTAAALRARKETTHG